MFIFPTLYFGPKLIKCRIAQNTLSGGTPIEADEDVIMTDGGGAWEITMTGIDLVGAERVRAWESWSTYLDSGATTVAVPMATNSRSNMPVHHRSGITNPYDLFTETQVMASPSVVAFLTNDCDLRATIVTITVEKGATIKGGETFSINNSEGPNPHRISRVISTAGNTFTVSIRPPLRSASTSGTPLNFDWPMCRARLDAGMDISPEVFLGKYAPASITFREVTV